MTLLCDRCQTPYQPADTWTRCPLCAECLIGTRRAERNDYHHADTQHLNNPRPTTGAEIEQAWRTRVHQLWRTELSV